MECIIGGGWVVWESFPEEVTFKPRAERRKMEFFKENMISFFKSNKCEILYHFYF